jgi:GNAT superfamily N-acetyltransferase
MVDIADGYTLRSEADARAAHAFLERAYWSVGITLAEVKRALSHSLVVSAWDDVGQVGMARVVSDRVSIAYVNDVFVLPAHSGRGLAGAMLRHLRNLPELANVGRWLLFTKDAQSLYAAQGWREYPWPDRTMVIDPKVFG